MWIPPAYSPIPLSGIWKGLRARPSAIGGLEERLKEWYAAERALATSSGTHALQLAIRGALEHGGSQGPVALPAFNCFDLATAAVWVGAPVVFYDIHPMTLAPEPESLTRTAGQAGALVVANLFGYPLDWDLIRNVTAAHSIPVVEDAAQGLGAEWKGQPAGTFGDLSILSFGRGKGWTGGSGGAVLARNGFGASLPRTLPGNPGSRMAEAVKTTGVWLLARPSLYGIPARLPGLGLGETHYKPPTNPQGITPFAAAMVLAGREPSLEEVGVRRQNAERIRAEISGGSGDGQPAGEAVSMACPEPLSGGRCGYLRLPGLPREGKEGAGELAEVSKGPGEGTQAPEEGAKVSREGAKATREGAKALEDRKRGIYRSYPRALQGLGVMEPLMQDPQASPGAIRLARDLLTWPTHSRSGG